MIRFVVAAPTYALRAGLRAMLATGEGLEEAGEANSLTGLGDFRPGEIDVVVAAAASGPELAEALRSTGVGDFPAVLFLVESAGDVQSLAGMPAGNWGFLPLEATAGEMVAAVHALHEGLMVGSPHLLAQVLEARQVARTGLPGGAEAASEARAEAWAKAGSEDESRMVEALTSREAEVLQLIAQGMANKQIAQALGISDHTVKFHISSIFSKLGAMNRTEAVRIGARTGLILL